MSRKRGPKGSTKMPLRALVSQCSIVCGSKLGSLGQAGANTPQSTEELSKGGFHPEISEAAKAVQLPTSMR